MAKKAAANSISAAARIVVLHGPERFVQDMKTQETREALKAAHGDVELMRFDGDSAAMADILDECRSFGLMQQHKLIVVDNADKLLKADDDGPAPRGGGIRRAPRDIMTSYAEAPSEQATLVLRAERWYPGKLDKVIEKTGVIIKCERPSSDEAAAWAMQQAKTRHAAAIEPAAVDMLVEHLGADLGRIDSELGKLALLHPGRAINADDVRAMVGVTREEELWSIQNQLITGNAEDGLRRLRDLIEISREDPVPITYAYIDLARKLHAVARALKQGDQLGPLQGKFRLWGPAGDAVVRAARRLPVRTAARLLSSAVETDLKLKTSSGDAVRALEVLTLRFAGVFHAASR